MSKVCEEVQEGSALIFGDTPIFSYNEVHGGGKKLPYQKSSDRPVVSIRCRLVTDGHRIEGLTDGQTHEDSVGYRTSMASRGKKCAAGPSVFVRSTIIPAVGRRNSRKFRTRAASDE